MIHYSFHHFLSFSLTHTCAIVELAERLGEDMAPKHVFGRLAKHGFAGFSARLSKAGVAFLTAHEGVEYVEENREVSVPLVCPLG